MYSSRLIITIGIWATTNRQRKPYVIPTIFVHLNIWYPSHGDLAEDVKEYMQLSLGNYVNSTKIIEMVSTLLGMNVTTNTISVAKKQYTNKIL